MTAGAAILTQDPPEPIPLHMEHRNYAAGVLGRFISRDPIGHNGNLNLYAYPTNPVSFVDPSGLEVRLSDAAAARFPIMRETFEKAVTLAKLKAREHQTCGNSNSWPGNFEQGAIDYLEALEGNWNVTFDYDPLDYGPGFSAPPMVTQGANSVFFSELGVPARTSNLYVNKLADQILHELTHAGIYRNYDLLQESDPQLHSQCSGPYDEKLVGAPGPGGIGDDPGTHPSRYFYQGIYRHLSTGGGYGHP